jgi:hypothetical protein
MVKEPQATDRGASSKMNTLGIYFGPRHIGIVEVKNQKLVNNSAILYSALANSEPASDKVPEDIKILTVIKDELKRKKTEAKEVMITLSGKDLIIRSFEIPLMPRDEVRGAVNFEVRKYIPFKVEDLVSDFQCKFNQASKKTRVLFVGAKKEIIEKYIHIVKELGLRLLGIEYAAFSILKLLKFTEFKEKGIVANIDLDLIENDEVNFLVLENGFPLFCRDFSLDSSSPDSAKASSEADTGMLMEKLKREVRISLDYYDRTFPVKTIDRVFFVMNRDFRLDLETFIKDMSLKTEFMNFDKYVAKYVGRPLPFSLSFIKGYGSTLLKSSTAIRLNLLSVQEKKIKKSVSESSDKKPLLQLKFKKELLLPVAALLVCGLTWGAGHMRISAFQADLKKVLAMRPAVSSVSPKLKLEQLTAAATEQKSRIKSVSDLVKQQVYVSELLDVIPRVFSEDMSFSDLSFRRDQGLNEFVIRGTVSKSDSTLELEQVNSFLDALKNSQPFQKNFSTMEILSVVRNQKANNTGFIISCRK